MSLRAQQIILGVALMGLLSGALGSELSLLVNGYAKHIKPEADTQYNERNWGWGLQYDYDYIYGKSVPFVMASGFKDSRHNMSYYAGGGIQRRFDVAPALDNLHFDIGLVAFLMTRKTYDNNKPFIGVLPALTVGIDHLAINITYIPNEHGKATPLWFFQFKVPLTTF